MPRQPTKSVWLAYHCLLIRGAEKGKLSDAGWCTRDRKNFYMLRGDGNERLIKLVDNSAYE
jgi:hypothetical protein